MSKPRRRHDASRLAFGETVRHSASRGRRVEAPGLAVCQRPHAALGQVQEPGGAGGEAGSRGRMGQAVELNEFQKALVDEGLFRRGQIIAGYSMVEYVLADVAVRLNLKFPYLIKDRIKAAKEIVDRPEYE